MSSSQLGKRTLEVRDMALQSFVAELGITRDGRAFPSRRDVNAAEMDGAYRDEDKIHELSGLSTDMYEMDAYLGSTIVLRARHGTVLGAFRFDGEVSNNYRMAKYVCAEYDAPDGKAVFSVRDLCAILKDFSPPAEMEDLGDDQLVNGGHYDILKCIERVPGTECTYDIEWEFDPLFDMQKARAAREAKGRADRAAAEAAAPSMRGVGAFGMDGACTAGCGYFAIANSIYCSKCAPSAPIVKEACPKCGKDLSVLGPNIKERHRSRCFG